MESFGAKLKSVREGEGLSLEAAASIAGIRLLHLQALEQDDFDVLPDEVTVKGYLRKYAESLHVDAGLMIQDYVRDRVRRRPTRAGGEIGTRIPLLLYVGGILVVLAIIGSWGARSRDTTEALRNTSPVRRTIPAAVIVPVETEPPTEIPADTDTVRDPGGMNIPDHGVGTAVENRQLAGENDRFTEGTAVWFWTRVEDGNSGETIHHVWLREGVEADRISLKLGGSSWRTYSRKTLGPESAGNWAVEARDESGLVLARSEFLCVPLNVAVLVPGP